jgi:hypothetical protein
MATRVSYRTNTRKPAVGVDHRAEKGFLARAPMRWHPHQAGPTLPYPPEQQGRAWHEPARDEGAGVGCKRNCRGPKRSTFCYVVLLLLHKAGGQDFPAYMCTVEGSFDKHLERQSTKVP